MKNRLKTYKNRTKTAKKPPYWRFCGFSDFQNSSFSKLAGLADENHQNNEKPLKTYKNRTKTAEKPPYWRFGGFSNFENP